MIAVGSVCSGYGGLELGIASVVPDTVLRWVADYEPPTVKRPNPNQGAARILAHRFPGVPNLGDITITDWATTPPVDIVSGGTPCQDVSIAGARGGMGAGTRSGIWSSMVEAIAHHRPTLVVWENVGGVLSAGADSNMEPCPICVGDERDTHLRALGRVHGDLAEIGYDAVWCGLRASDVGAPHARYRVFVCAWPIVPDSGGEAVGLRAGLCKEEPSGVGGGRPDDHAAPTAADADSTGRQGPQPAEGSDLLDRGPVADADGGERPPRRQQDTVRQQIHGTAATGDRPDAIDWREFTDAVRRWERLTRPAPDPTEPGPKAGRRLAPGFVEWLMGLPEGWVTGVPGLARNDQLKALGNGVVPQQAAAALEYLLLFAPDWVIGKLFGGAR